MNIRNIRIYIFFIVTYLHLSGCQSPIKTNVILSSFDIKESKANGVFVAEYIPSTMKLNFKGQSFYIQQVWIEHYWLYLDQMKNIETRKSIRGFIKLKNDENIFDLNFICNNKNGGITGGKLFFEISEPKDTLHFKFYINNDTIPVIMCRFTSV